MVTSLFNISYFNQAIEADIFSTVKFVEKMLPPAKGAGSPPFLSWCNGVIVAVSTEDVAEFRSTFLHSVDYTFSTPVAAFICNCGYLFLFA